MTSFIAGLGTYRKHTVQFSVSPYNQSTYVPLMGKVPEPLPKSKDYLLSLQYRNYMIFPLHDPGFLDPRLFSTSITTTSPQSWTTSQTPYQRPKTQKISFDKKAKWDQRNKLRRSRFAHPHLAIKHRVLGIDSWSWPKGLLDSSSAAYGARLRTIDQEL